MSLTLQSPLGNKALAVSTSVDLVSSPAQIETQRTATVRSTEVRRDERLTYRPSQARAVQQYVGQVDDLGRPAHWWLYARSDDEVRWLNQYGFPSPAEEKQLRLSTDAELLRLTALGDKNAKAHVVARSMRTAFDKQEPSRAVAVQTEVRALLVEGGPYQAATVLDAVGETLSAYTRISEKDRTEPQRKVLNQLSDLLPQTLFLGEVYGDYTLNGIYNSYPALVVRSVYGVNDKHQPDASTLASLLAANSRDRAEQGEPPLVISTRPRPILGSPSRFSKEAGAIILERK